MDKPRHLVVVVLEGNFGSTSAPPIPSYILTNPAYGPSPVAGSYGWWGGTGNGNTSSAALWRPAVMARWIALHQALGAAFDGDPDFEAIMFQEDSWFIGAVSDNNGGYPGDSVMIPLIQNLLTATLVAFPHTSVIFENTWAGTATATQQLEQFMIENRVAPGTADTFGQTWVNANGGQLNSWGMNAYIGVTVTGSTYSGPDYRPIMPSMVDIEGPDMGAYDKCTSDACTAGYTPQDICNALNQSFHSSHAFWTYLGNNPNISGNWFPSYSTWSNVVATANQCPLVNTAYPAVYPQ